MAEDEDEDRQERQEITEPQFRRSWRDALNADKNIQEAAQVAAEARAAKRAVIKRLEGYGVKRKALKFLEQFAKLEEDEREVIVAQLLKLAEWSRVRLLFRDGDNQGPVVGNGDFGDVVKKLPKPLRGPGRPRKDEDRAGL